MVKVLLCHHFQSQTVVPCGSEPVAVRASPKKLFVATVDRRVEVYDLSQAACPRIHWFNTEATVAQIVHNVSGDYLATLETKKSRRKEYRFIKVYLNWQVDPGKQPMKVRIAGKPYGVNVKDLKAGKAEVIDVPFTGYVTTIATCEHTTNLAIAINNAVYLYHLVEKTLPNTEHTYRDVQLFLELAWDTPVSSVTICEDYVACLNEKFVHLIRMSYVDGGPKCQGLATVGEEKANTPPPIQSSLSHTEESTLEKSSGTVDSNYSKFRLGYLPSISTDDHAAPSVVAGYRKYSNFGVRSSPNPSSLPVTPEQTTTKPWKNTFGKIENDDNFVVWDFGDDENSTGDARTSTSRARNIPGARFQGRTIFLKGFHAPSGSSPPLSVSLQGKPQPPSVSDKRGGTLSTAGTVAVTVLIQLKQNLNDKYRGLQLIPTYRPDQEDRSGQLSASAPSADMSPRNTMTGLCCFLASSYSGVMYSVVPKPQLISHYKFASEALEVVCGHSLIHVVTRVSVETYTARCNAAAVHNVDTFDNVTTSFPPSDLETCLVSIQPFIGIRQVALSGQQLHLLTKMENKGETKKGHKSEDNNWSLYVLQSSSAADLYKDMITLGTKNQESSPPTYLHLLQEGHMALKSDLLLGSSGDIAVEDLLRESCALLGDYFTRPHCDDWRLALPYYNMSGLRIQDIVRQASLLKQINKQMPFGYGKGLMNYLNYVLFEDSEKEDIQQTWCDAILEFYVEADADNLSRVMLFSKYQQYDAAKAVSLLERNMNERRNKADRNRSTDLLCLAVLNLRLCEPDKALSALSAISKGEVISFCVDHHQLLHRDYTELSPLAQLMRRHYPQVFITILVSLQDTDTIPLDQALALLKSNVYQSEVHRNAHVKEYLESILNDQKRWHIFDEAVKILCDIYIRRLIEWKPPSSREFPVAQFLMPRGTGYFGQRYSWLDFLPPFMDPSAMKQPCQYLQFSKAGPRSKVLSQPIKIAKPDVKKTGCRCCLCNEDLLKLQSLLSSQFVTEELVRLILDKIRGKESTVGFESLWIICITHMDFRQAVDIVVEKYPALLPEFVIGCVGNDLEKLRYTVESIVCALRKSVAYPSQYDDIYVQSFKGILSEMSALLSPKEFLSLLPTDGNLLVFLPYIQRCCQGEEMRHLKAEIVTKGDCLKTNV